MEILKIETFESEFYLGILFLLLVITVCCIVNTILISSLKKQKDKIVSIFFLGFFMAIGIGASIWMPKYIENGVKVRYIAKVTDTAEVYKQGYEIVDEEYGIYTLRRIDTDERVHVQNP